MMTPPDNAMDVAIIRHLKFQASKGMDEFIAWSVGAMLRGNKMDELYIRLFGKKIGSDMIKVHKTLIELQ